MKRLFVVSGLVFLLAAPTLQAASAGTYGNVDTIMADNTLGETATRYSAVQLSFFPEYATRLGFNAAEERLDNRTDDRDSQALRTLKIVEESLGQIKRKQLSVPRQTEYDMLKGMITYDMYNINRNRNAHDPMIYSSVFDALYDLRIKQMNYQDIQRRHLATRVSLLPNLAKQAERNLTSAPGLLAQLAMEQAYSAYLSFDEIANDLINPIADETGKSQMRKITKTSKGSIKNLFELFKKLAQENSMQDFRLGSKAYDTVLKYHYFIDQKEGAMSKFLLKNLQAAQLELFLRVNRFPMMDPDLAEISLEAEMAEKTPAPESAEQTDTIQDLNPADPIEEFSLEEDEVVQTLLPKPVAAKPNKKKNNNRATAADFYPVAQHLTLNTPELNVISALSVEASKLNQIFTSEEVLPMATASFKIREIPAYYGYFKPYMFVPPFGMQTNPTHDFFVRLPSGDGENKQLILDQDFNIPVLKLLIAGQIVPGLAYRSAYRSSYLSPFRKQYSIPTLRNGWEVYAQHLAREQAYIETDEELLFLAWFDYVRAIQALVDFNLHTQRFNYTQAINWLTEEHGFDKTQAELIIKNVSANPGEAVSYIYGYDAIKNLRDKYRKKQGKSFNPKDFHAKLLGLGDIPLNRLETEMNFAYDLEKNRLSQAMSSPFYM